MKYLLTICLLALVCAAQAQQVYLEGRVLDAQTGEPLPHAMVGFRMTPKGTASNLSGEFRLYLDAGQMRDSLVLSYLGYQSQSYPVQNLIGKTLTFKLIPEASLLQSVKVTPQDVMDIVEEAIQRIPENHPNYGHLLQGFYREQIVAYQRDQPIRHQQINNEAILHIYKGSYADRKPLVQTKLIRGRSRQLAYRDGTEGGSVSVIGIISLMASDFVQNPGQLFNLQKLKRYQFDLLDVQKLDEHQVYVIGVTQEKRGEALFEGRLYIEKDTKAFVGYNMKLMPAGRDWVLGKISLSQKFILSLLNTQLSLDHLVVEDRFKKINGKWYLNHGEMEMSMSYALSFLGEKMDRDVHYIASYQTMDVKNPAKPFDENEITNAEEAFSSLISTYDEKFWDGYTIMIENQNDSVYSKIDLDSLRNQQQAIDILLAAKEKSEMITEGMINFSLQKSSDDKVLKQEMIFQNVPYIHLNHKIKLENQHTKVCYNGVEAYETDKQAKIVKRYSAGWQLSRSIASAHGRFAPILSAGHFYDDLINQYLGHQITLKEATAPDGTPCYQLQFTGGKKGELATSDELWIRKADHLPYQWTNTIGKSWKKITLEEIKPYKVAASTFDPPSSFDYPVSEAWTEAGALEEMLQRWDKAPAFTITSLDGDTLSLSALKGKYVLLDFWFVRCPPCIRLLPTIAKLHEELPKDRIAVISVNLDHPADLAAFVKRNPNFQMPFYQGFYTTMEVDYKVSVFPTIYLINPRGYIDRVQLGLGTDFISYINKKVR